MKKRILSLITVICILMSCFAFSASASGLTLLNKVNDGKFLMTSGAWTYLANYDSLPVTEVTDGIGGKSTSDKYAKIDPSLVTDTKQGQLIMNYYNNFNSKTSNYVVFTMNLFSNPQIDLYSRCSSNAKVLESLSNYLIPGRWNNIAFILNTSTSKITPYINGVAYTDKTLSDGTNFTKKDGNKVGQIRIYFYTTETEYRIDDFAIYTCEEKPSINLPVISDSENFATVDNTLYYSGDVTVDSITSNAALINAYSDNTFSTPLDSSAVITEGNVIVLTDAFNASSENVKAHNYYTAAPAPITSGKVTDTIDWSYNTISKTLTFTGTGAMPDWSTDKVDGVNADNHISNRPWIDYNAEMTKVVFGEGITSVGTYTFAQAKCLTDVEFSSTIEVIKSYSFFHTAITEIEFADGLKTIEAQAFAINKPDVYKKLTKAVIPASVEFVHEAAFAKQTDITVYCYEESAAHKFAVNNGVEFFLYDADYAIVYDADTMTATIKNFNGEYEKATVIFSNTSTGVLNSVDFKEIDMPAIGEDATVSAETLTQNPGTATEIMLWDSMTSCKPLCSSVGKKFAQEVTPEEVTE